MLKFQDAILDAAVVREEVEEDVLEAQVIFENIWKVHLGVEVEADEEKERVEAEVVAEIEIEKLTEAVVDDRRAEVIVIMEVEENIVKITRV
jgi:hypothetical protein